MSTQADRLVSEIQALPAEDKIRVLDAILTVSINRIMK